MNTNLEVANTIASQIGNRAFLMMGTRFKVGDVSSLFFDIKGCRQWNRLKITLDVCDTYTVSFFRVRGHFINESKVVELVYAENLHSVIEDNTGLRLSL